MYGNLCPISPMTQIMVPTMVFVDADLVYRRKGNYIKKY